MSNQSAQIEQEIVRLTHEWIEAVGRRDVNALDRILADDFLIAGWLPGGKLGNKQFYIDDCLRPVDVEQATFSYDQWQFRVYDEFVIANCVFKCHALVAGKELSASQETVGPQPESAIISAQEPVRPEMPNMLCGVKRALFRAQRNHRIDHGGAPRREVTGQ